MQEIHTHTTKLRRKIKSVANRKLQIIFMVCCLQIKGWNFVLYGKSLRLVKRQTQSLLEQWIAYSLFFIIIILKGRLGRKNVSSLIKLES